MNRFSHANSITISRRRFHQVTALAGAGLALGTASVNAADEKKIKMFKNLGPGHIGVSGNQQQLIDYAVKFGFGGVSVNLGDVEKMSSAQRQELVAQMKEKNIQWGPAGLAVEFRQTDEKFKEGLKNFPAQAKALQEVNATRVSTWILPGSNELTYIENYKQHRDRLAECAKILADHNCRLGLEFVGPKTLRDKFRFPFAYTQKEMMGLCKDIGTGNMGLLLDSWHWHTSYGTLDELKQLTNADIIEVHVNDAQKERKVDELIDNERLLPCTTGAIDLKGFINALHGMGYDGPISCEPFDKELNAMENEPALEKTIAALNRLFELIEA